MMIQWLIKVLQNLRFFFGIYVYLKLFVDIYVRVYIYREIYLKLINNKFFLIENFRNVLFGVYS